MDTIFCVVLCVIWLMSFLSHRVLGLVKWCDCVFVSKNVFLCSVDCFSTLLTRRRSSIWLFLNSDVDRVKVIGSTIFLRYLFSLQIIVFLVWNGDVDFDDVLIFYTAGTWVSAIRCWQKWDIVSMRSIAAHHELPNDLVLFSVQAARPNHHMFNFPTGPGSSISSYKRPVWHKSIVRFWL